MTRGPSSSLDVEAMLQARHGSSAEQLWDHEADLAYPRTEISELMQSPCRPDENGYFGATYGTPTKVFYEFALEAQPTTDIRQAVTVVQEHLMDVVLASTFPTLCSFTDNGGVGSEGLSSGPTQRLAINGYRFGRELLDFGRTCKPLEAGSNRCIKVAGQVYFFGDNSSGRNVNAKDIMTYAQSVIGLAFSTASNSLYGLGVERVQTTAIQWTDPRDNVNDSNTFEFPPWAIYGLVVSFLCVVLGLIILTLYIKKQRIHARNLRKLEKRTMTDSTASVKHTSLEASSSLGGGSLESAMVPSLLGYAAGSRSVSSGPLEDIEEPLYEEEEEESFEEEYDTMSGDHPSLTSSLTGDDTMSYPPHYLDDNGRFRDYLD